MSYSLDGQFIAVGMESGAIYWYHCSDNSRTYRYMSSAKVIISLFVRVIAFDDELVMDASGLFKFGN